MSIALTLIWCISFAITLVYAFISIGLNIFHVHFLKEKLELQGVLHSLSCVFILFFLVYTNPFFSFVAK